jgi:NADH:ubiquinone oxidoreductase subunit F (NADH-binding)
MNGRANISPSRTIFVGATPLGTEGLLEAIKAVIERGPEGMLAEMKLSNLRGRGGAGFTTAIK